MKKYIGSIVLGLNDALVEITGALAGFTLVLQSNYLIALLGALTGLAASLSMAASQYLAILNEETKKIPKTAAMYTGIAYFLTVLLLVAPFLIFQSAFVALAGTIIVAILIILAFTKYASIINNVPFWRRAAQMVSISLIVAGITFLASWSIQNYFPI